MGEDVPDAYKKLVERYSKDDRKPGDKVSLEALYETASSEYAELFPDEAGSEKYKRNLSFALDTNETQRIPRHTFAADEHGEKNGGLESLPSNIDPDSEVGTLVEYKGELWVVIENKQHKYGDRVDWDNLTIAPLKSLKMAFGSDLK